MHFLVSVFRFQGYWLVVWPRHCWSCCAVSSMKCRVSQSQKAVVWLSAWFKTQGMITHREVPILPVQKLQELSMSPKANRLPTITRTQKIGRMGILELHLPEAARACPRNSRVQLVDHRDRPQERFTNHADPRRVRRALCVWSFHICFGAFLCFLFEPVDLVSCCCTGLASHQRRLFQDSW